MYTKDENVALSGTVNLTAVMYDGGAALARHACGGMEAEAEGSGSRSCNRRGGLARGESTPPAC